VGKVAKLADSVVLRLPRGRAHPRDLVHLLSGWRVLAIGFGAVLAVAGGYAVARQSALFAVQTLEIRGAPPAVEEAVRTTLGPVEGQSLLRLDLESVQSRLTAIPSVRDASLDRAFPHTLRVNVTAERPVAVLRRGSEAWLVSARGRVIRPLEQPRLSRLPRVWVPLTVAADAGDRLADGSALKAVTALAALDTGPERLPARVAQARANDDELTLVLAAGTELRLADDEELALKLAVAREVLLALDPNVDGWPAYIDLTVPGRPVVGGSVSQLGSET
jgi:cell division protein FtsQ